ncbi:hypothetical protein BESB_025010 [Besnoitia besnoiti]|uniref:Uncharacterized protein n=1 Tax=Besnoitia besnoiti TaxID=94643 RepID=A0A2A9M0N8_BESBE|nr:uncharacterized protein BESB_025010 [Besnoitia besnoiti]PFH31535.1 hypothetical protein BESB_025010 [Besnoitia besnoiti]
MIPFQRQKGHAPPGGVHSQAWIPPSGTPALCDKRLRERRRSMECTEEGLQATQGDTWVMTTLPIQYSDGSPPARVKSRGIDKVLPALVIPDAPTSGPEYAAVFYFRQNDLYGKQAPVEFKRSSYGLQSK